MPDFDITINFLSGTSYTNNFSNISNMQFFGFQSDMADITSVVISGNNSYFGFAIDNHAFGGTGTGTGNASVPEPAGLILLALGLIGLTITRKQKLS